MTSARAQGQGTHFKRDGCRLGCIYRCGRSPSSTGGLRPDCIEEEDAAHDDTILQDVVTVLVPLARRTRDVRACEDQRRRGTLNGDGIVITEP